MPTYRADVEDAFLPTEYGALIVNGVTEGSVAIRSGVNVITTSSERLRVPVVLADPNAAWVPEGFDIPISDPQLGEVDVFPTKLAGLTIISRELADDSNPAAAQVIGESLSRDLSRKLDDAFYGAQPPPAPEGLAALAGVADVAAGAYDDLDAFAEGMTAVEANGGMVSAWTMAPQTWLALSRLKQAAGSNMPLLAADPTAATGRSIFGAPAFVTPSVAPNVVYGYDGRRCLVVMREESRVEVDISRYFESDRVAVRGIMRVGFAFPDPGSVTRLTFTPA